MPRRAQRSENLPTRSSELFADLMADTLRVLNIESDESGTFSASLTKLNQDHESWKKYSTNTLDFPSKKQKEDHIRSVDVIFKRLPSIFTEGQNSISRNLSTRRNLLEKIISIVYNLHVDIQNNLETKKVYKETQVSVNFHELNLRFIWFAIYGYDLLLKYTGDDITKTEEKREDKKKKIKKAFNSTRAELRKCYLRYYKSKFEKSVDDSVIKSAEQEAFDICQKEKEGARKKVDDIVNAFVLKNLHPVSLVPPMPFEGEFFELLGNMFWNIAVEGRDKPDETRKLTPLTTLNLLLKCKEHHFFYQRLCTDRFQKIQTHIRHIEEEINLTKKQISNEKRRVGFDANVSGSDLNDETGEASYSDDPCGRDFLPSTAEIQAQQDKPTDIATGAEKLSDRCTHTVSSSSLFNTQHKTISTQRKMRKRSGESYLQDSSVASKKNRP